MAQDKFKPVAATFQIFKDGEAVSARKLDGIIRNTQEGFDEIQRSLGDSQNYSLTFSGLPLFQNSIARSMGSADELTIAPIRVFNIPQELESQQQGMVRFPYSTAMASDIGNRSQNLLPVLNQDDKIGIGCIADDGSQCTKRFNSIYNEEKNILNNGQFTEQLNGWQISGVVFDGEYARLDTDWRFQTLAYSEDFSQWTNVSGVLTERDFDNPDGQSNAHAFQAVTDGTDDIYLEVSGHPVVANTEWCFSVYMIASGTSMPVFLEIDGATHVRGTYGNGGVDPSGTIYSVDVDNDEWKRYYVHGTYPTARGGAIARIHIGRGNVVDSNQKLYIWGAQLETSTSPSTYQLADGLQTSGREGAVYFGQSFNSIPSKTYQASIEWNEITLPWSLYQDNKVLISDSSSTSEQITFDAADNTDITNIYIHVSGGTNSNMAMSSFRVDPGTPCHALNCPGFSAYDKIRRYRSVLPKITNTNSQYFGKQLRFPNEINLSDTSRLPANILGIFDHEQNHSVPTTLVDWKLSHWPIGNSVQGGFVNDPEFLSTWVSGVTNQYPSEFAPTDASESGLLRYTIFTHEFSGTLFTAVDPATLSPSHWIEANDFSEGEGVAIPTTGNPNKGSYGGTLKQQAAHPMPIIRENVLNGTKALETDGTMHTEFDTPLAITSAWDYTAVAVYKSPASEDVGLLIGGNVADPFAQGVQFVRQQSAGTAYAFYDNSNTISENIDNYNTLLNGNYHITIIRRERDGGATTGKHWVFHDGVDVTKDPPVTSTNDSATFDAIFSCGGSGGYSRNGTQCVEMMLFPSLLTDSQTEGVFQHYADKYFDTVGDVDVLQINAASGVCQGIHKTIALTQDEVATWTYVVRGDTGLSGVKETYTAISGTVEVDTEITDAWTTLTNGQTLENEYQVTSTLPGDTSWSSPINGWWEITRHVRALTSNAFVDLSLELCGDDASGYQTIFVDSFDIMKQDSSSSKFEYCADSILGLNWDGRCTHIRDENLFKFSNNMLLWQSSGLVGAIDTDSSTQVRIVGSSGTIAQTVPGSDLLDDMFTLSWLSKSSSPTSGEISLTQGSTIQTFPWTLTTQNISGIILFSGINYETGLDLEVKWRLWGDDAVIHSPQLVHGSGTVNYVPTSAESVRKYRRSVQPTSLTLDTSWAPGYALVDNGILQTNQSGVITSDADSWEVIDTRGFPQQGVIRIAGQEYGYHNKVSGYFVDNVVGWRGTTFDPSIVASGSRVTNVSIPQPISYIDPVTQEIEFKNIIPAPLGDWANTMNLQVYNTHVSNIDRFSLQTTAISLTQATGNMLTSFLQHIADHRRHLRLSQLCSYIIDSSTWCASPVIRAVAFVVDQTVEELTETVQLNVEALRFVKASAKEVSISWGDGTYTTLTGSKNNFTSIPHTYDLKQFASPKAYTINVVIKDLDLDFSRSVSTAVIISPKVNPAGLPTKSTFRVAAKIITQDTHSMIAGAKIKDQNSTSTLAGAKMA